MKFTDISKKLFIGGRWTLAYRDIKNDDGIIPSTGEKFKYSIVELETQGDYWYADPFPIQADGKIYIFCEVFNQTKEKGCIGVAEFREGHIEKPRIILEKKYHMSYPCVFQYENQYYMIPETSENRTIELYRAVVFPDQWILEKILQKNVDSVDSTVFCDATGFYILTYESNRKKDKQLSIYRLDMEKREIQKSAMLTYDKNTGRPAGNIMSLQGKIIRPSQDGQSRYGGRIIFNGILEWTEINYTEEQIGFLSIENIELENSYAANRVHTINRLNNFEIIDIFKEEFDLFRPIRMVRRKIRKHRIKGK